MHLSAGGVALQIRWLVHSTGRTTMRHYPANAPEALARLVAAALLADGGLDKHELDALDRHDVVQKLGLSRQDFDHIVHAFCEDMQAVSLCDHGGPFVLDRATTDQLLAEVTAPALQIKALRMLLDIAAADDRLAPSELTLVSQAMTRWGLQLHTVSAHRDPVIRPLT
jgi:uncharacterized tellurite resistance protein B-like protein